MKLHCGGNRQFGESLAMAELAMVYGLKKVLVKIGGEEAHQELTEAINEEISSREAGLEAKKKRKKELDERRAQATEERRVQDTRPTTGSRRPVWRHWDARGNSRRGGKKCL